jgi:hypothetical protein
MRCRSSMWPSKKRRVRMTVLGLIVCGGLCMGGCFETRVVRDPTIPHRLSRPVEAWEWRRLPSGEMAECPVLIPAGDWVVSAALEQVAP